MAKKKKNGFAGILIGPLVAFAALAALWKNETRYDYHKEAARTQQLQSLDYAQEGELFSFTDSMDQGLTLDGDYVESFVGFLQVQRSAEIYAWEEDEDEDGASTWRLTWMSGVENNSRNSGIRQKLSSETFLPAEYLVGKLPIESKSIEFVDRNVSIPSSQLKLIEKGINHGLKSDGTYFQLRKNRSRNLGDERVSYRGIPVPRNATYFGKYSDGYGVAYDQNKRTGLINQMIQDRGILHHLVAGDRQTALNSMKQHITRIKWIVRGIGSAATVFGFIFLFSNLARFLFGIPIIGPIAEWGAMALGVAIGLPLAVMTIIAGSLFNNPMILVALIILIVGLVGLMIYYRKQGKKTQELLRQGLEVEHGRKLESDDIKELEFAELVKLAQSDSNLDGEESLFLNNWGRKHGWDSEKIESMIENAHHSSVADKTEHSTESHLQNLIRLALADGTLSPFEMRTIRATAQKVGYNNRELNKLMDSVTRSAELRTNFLKSKA